MRTSATVNLNVYSVPVTEGNQIDMLSTILNSGERRGHQHLTYNYILTIV